MIRKISILERRHCIISNVVEFASFNLKKEVSVSDFIIVSDKFNSVFLSTQKGYIFRKLLREVTRFRLEDKFYE